MYDYNFNSMLLNFLIKPFQVVDYVCEEPFLKQNRYKKERKEKVAAESVISDLFFIWKKKMLVHLIIVSAWKISTGQWEITLKKSIKMNPNAERKKMLSKKYRTYNLLIEWTTMKRERILIKNSSTDNFLNRKKEIAEIFCALR